MSLLNRLWVFCVCCSLIPVPCSLSAEYPRGPLKIALSDKWTVNEDPGPELLKASLSIAPTVTLSIWKYAPGPMSPEQFLSGLRSDLGWSAISNQAVEDRRFGRVNVSLFQKSGAFESLQFRIRTYDFVMGPDIYVIEMRAPETEFAAADGAFRTVFDDLSRVGGPAPSPARPPVRPPAPPPAPEVVSSPTPPVASSEPPVPAPSVPLPTRSDPIRPDPHPSSYTFLYELSDGIRLGFDTSKNSVSVMNPDGSVKATYSINGKPYISPLGLFSLSDEYAYRLDPLTGNVVGRESIEKLIPRRPSSGAVLAAAPQVPSPVRIPAAAPKGSPDQLKAAMERAANMKKTLGVKHAIEFLMNERPAAETSGSPHLYEFYFRLGEYWEEAGDLETALAYYRLATRAID